MENASKSVSVMEDLCWPWMGIVTNIVDFSETEELVFDNDFLRAAFLKYKPLGVKIIKDEQGKTAKAVVHFGKELIGFINAMKFENFFEVGGRSKGDWNANESSLISSHVYGWIARADDYYAKGEVGDYLRDKGEVLKFSVVAGRLQCETDSTISELREDIVEKEKMCQKFYDESCKLQSIVGDHILRISKEQEKITYDLELKKSLLDWHIGELSNLQVLTEYERQKLEKEKWQSDERIDLMQISFPEHKESDEYILRLIEKQRKEKDEILMKILRSEKELEVRQNLELNVEHLKATERLEKDSLQTTSTELKQAIENVSRLVQQEKSEKEEELQKLLQLRKETDFKHKLRLEIEKLKSKLQIMKLMDASMRKKMEMTTDDLDQKVEVLKHLETVSNQTNVETVP